MDDLISRQAAIDTVKKHYRVDNDLLEVIVYELEKLPSAQPEIIRCKDCEYGEQDEVGRWFCRSFGCQVGEADGSGFCADALNRKEGAKDD